MTASIAAHAVVFAAIAMTWGEAVLVEGGTRPTLVSIDLTAREGAAGPRAQIVTETAEPQHMATPAPATTPAPVAAAQAPAHTSPQAAPSPAPAAAQSGGGGEGRKGQGTAVVTTLALPPARLLPARAITAPTAPARPDTGEAQGAGGSGGGRTDQAGNSAVANFKGRVYAHLQRHRRTNTIGSGEVLVAFTIAPDGTASAISVARGSGSSRFDHEALALVRRASPFPRPPDGAAHSFTFAITGQ